MRRGVGRLIAALTVLAAVPVGVRAQATAPELTVLTDDGGTLTVPVARDRGYASVRLSILTDLGWTITDQGRVVRVDGPEGAALELRPGSPYFRWNEVTLQLADPVTRSSGAVLVPLQLISDFLPDRMPTVYAFDGPALTLRAGAADRAADARTAAPRRGADAAGTPPAPTRGTVDTPPPPVAGRTGAPPARTGRAGEPPARGRAATDRTPPPVGGRTGSRPPDLSGGANTPPPSLDDPPLPSTYSGPRVVVIDAGHGGADPGSMSRNGVREKDVALGVALALARSLESEPGVEVHLLRDDDTFVPLWDRGPLATEMKGQRPGIFVSIHANSFTSPARGFETYFLSEARTEHERRVAAIENAPITQGGAEFEPGSDLGTILNELRNLDHAHWSALLAEMIQDQIADIHPGPNRGVKQAPLAVLTNVLMPAVLVEVGYLSHADEARLLDRKNFQDQAGGAIAGAVLRFLERYPPGAGGGAGGRP